MVAMAINDNVPPSQDQISEIYCTVAWPQFYRGIFGNVYYVTRYKLFVEFLNIFHQSQIW